MKYEREFIEQQTARNYIVSYILCMMIFAMESIMALIWYFSQVSVIPDLDSGYLRFYWSGIIGSAVYPVFNYLTRKWRYHKFRIAIQLAVLLILQVWAALFAAFDVQHGNSGSAFVQILIVTAAILWIPKWLHYAINLFCWLGYLALVVFAAVSESFFYSEVVNSGIFLFLSCLIIHLTDSFQYSVFKASQERLRLQNEQLNMMAEQVRAAHSKMDEIRIMRHDLRHYALTVKQKLEQSDYQGIRDVTTDIARGLEHADLEKPLHAYTKIPEVDTILSQYRDWAAKEGIGFRVELSPPDMMETRDIAMLLMNALENAVNAVKAQPTEMKRYIKVIGERTPYQYYLYISNSYRPGTAVINSRTGLPIATRPGHGYGTKSMAAILRKYQAHFRFRADEQEFCLQVLIPIENARDFGPSAVENPEI